jgi:hypothetical protein
MKNKVLSSEFRVRSVNVNCSEHPAYRQAGKLITPNCLRWTLKREIRRGYSKPQERNDESKGAATPLV